jgi:hypothetical protein
MYVLTVLEMDKNDPSVQRAAASAAAAASGRLASGQERDAAVSAIDADDDEVARAAAAAGGGGWAVGPDAVEDDENVYDIDSDTRKREVCFVCLLVLTCAVMNGLFGICTLFSYQHTTHQVSRAFSHCLACHDCPAGYRPRVMKRKIMTWTTMTMMTTKTMTLIRTCPSTKRI